MKKTTLRPSNGKEDGKFTPSLGKGLINLLTVEPWAPCSPNGPSAPRSPWNDSNELMNQIDVNSMEQHNLKANLDNG